MQRTTYAKNISLEKISTGTHNETIIVDSRTDVAFMWTDYL